MRRSPLLPLLGLSVLAACLAVAFLSARAGASHGWTPPMDDAGKRPLLLTFGLYVTPDPAQNPIDPPERFTGYHTALDFEVLPEEQDADVPVYAACDGEVLAATTADGYGGVIVHRCLLDGKDVTVLYGHVDPASMTVKPGDAARKGERIALLAPAHSEGSDGTRKHLHFGIHRGREIEYLGYVQTEPELEAFADPAAVLGL